MSDLRIYKIEIIENGFTLEGEEGISKTYYANKKELLDTISVDLEITRR